MNRMSLAALFSAFISCSAQAALIDSFNRLDGPIVTDSLGTTESGGYTYVERNNSASGSTTDGTAQISSNRLLITGAQQTTSAANINTGGAYLNNFNEANVRVGVDVEYVLVGNGPNGLAGTDGNKFNNTFLMMLRSRVGQNFGTMAADQVGLVAVEFNPNGDLQIREQRTTSTLPTILNWNQFTGTTAARQPLPGTLPMTFGSGTFDLNQNGYLDTNEPIHLDVELNGTSIKVFVNGVQYGNPAALALTSAASGQINGIGLHKNRLGSTGGSLNQMATNVLVDNFDVTVVPEPASIALAAVIGCFAAMFRTCSRR